MCVCVLLFVVLFVFVDVLGCFMCLISSSSSSSSIGNKSIIRANVKTSKTKAIAVPVSLS